MAGSEVLPGAVTIDLGARVLLLSYAGRSDLHALPYKVQQDAQGALHNAHLYPRAITELRGFWARRASHTPRRPLSNRDLVAAVVGGVRSGEVRAAVIAKVLTHGEVHELPVDRARITAIAQRYAAEMAAQKPTAASTPVRGWSVGRRVQEIAIRAIPRVKGEMRTGFQLLISKQNIAFLIGGVVLAGALNLTPWGWLADAALIGISIYYGGRTALAGLKSAAIFVQRTTTASQPSDLDAAATALAEAVNALGAVGLIALLHRSMGRVRGAGGSVEAEVPAAAEVRAPPSSPRSPTSGPPKPAPKSATETPLSKPAASTGKRIGTAKELEIPDFLSLKQRMHTPPVTDGRSVLTADPSALLKGLHDGEFKILRQPKVGQIRVDFGKPIGEYWSDGTKVGQTQYGTVSFGKSGAHIYPANPKQW